MQAKAHERALTILTERRAVLDQIAKSLLAKETLERAELEAIIERAGIPAGNGRPQHDDRNGTVAPGTPIGTAS